MILTAGPLRFDSESYDGGSTPKLIYWQDSWTRVRAQISSLSLSLCSWFLTVYPCLFPRRSVASSSLIGPPAPDTRMPGETWRIHGRTAKHQSSTRSSSERLKKLTGELRRKNVLHFNFRHFGSEFWSVLSGFRSTRSSSRILSTWAGPPTGGRLFPSSPRK